MGQVLQRLYSIELQQRQRHHGMCSDFRNIPTTNTSISPRFPDLSQLPPELGLAVLSYLNPTDLCLAACVWDQLANDELLWQRLVSTLFLEFNNKLLGYKKKHIVKCILFRMPLSRPFFIFFYFFRSKYIEERKLKNICLDLCVCLKNT